MNLSRRWDSPFAQVPEWVIKADISSHAVRLWAALDRFAGLPQGAIPSRRVLADEWLHVSLDTLDRAKQELVDVGALSVEKRDAQTNRYILENDPSEGGYSRTGAQGDSRTGAHRKIVSPKIATVSLGEETSSPTSAAAARAALWDALVETTGITPESHGEKSRFGMSVSELIRMDATPAEVTRRGRIFRERYPGATVTDRALCNRWGELSQEAQNSNGKRYGRGMTTADIQKFAKERSSR